MRLLSIRRVTVHELSKITSWTDAMGYKREEETRKVFDRTAKTQRSHPTKPQLFKNPLSHLTQTPTIIQHAGLSHPILSPR
jgi:hypothetical protein